MHCVGNKQVILPRLRSAPAAVLRHQPLDMYAAPGLQVHAVAAVLAKSASGDKDRNDGRRCALRWTKRVAQFFVPGARRRARRALAHVSAHYRSHEYDPPTPRALQLGLGRGRGLYGLRRHAVRMMSDSKPPHLVIMYQKISLAWSHQGNDNHLDFTTPWRM